MVHCVWSYADTGRGYLGKAWCEGRPAPGTRKAYCREHDRKLIFDQGRSPWRRGKEFITRMIPAYEASGLHQDVQEAQAGARAWCMQADGHIDTGHDFCIDQVPKNSYRGWDWVVTEEGAERRKRKLEQAKHDAWIEQGRMKFRKVMEALAHAVCENDSEEVLRGLQRFDQSARSAHEDEHMLAETFDALDQAIQATSRQEQ